MKISKASWHYELYSKFGDGRGYCGEINLCPYMRKVFRGFMFICFIIFVGVIVGMFILEPFMVGTMWLITGFFNGYFLNNFALLFLNAIFLFGAGIIASVMGTKKIYSIYRRNTTEIPPSKFTTLLKVYYKSFHDKVCPMIEISKD